VTRPVSDGSTRGGAVTGAVPVPRTTTLRSIFRWPHTKTQWLSFGLANGIPIALIVAWFLASPYQPEYILPAPLDVLDVIRRELFGDLALQTLASFARITAALVIAMLVGGGLIMATQLIPALRTLVTGRFLPLLNAVPSVGWAILGVIWLGVTDSAVIFVVTLILLPFSMVTLSEGLKSIDPDLREMGRSFTRSRLVVFTRIEFPLLLPYVIAAARLSFSVGWKVAIIAEFFGAKTGIGLVMNQGRQNFDTALVFGSIITVVIVVFVVETFVFELLSNAVARRAGAAPVARGIQ
jgi:NitT/TauT family transport system permease protein